jgi:hypothetical protein
MRRSPRRGVEAGRYYAARPRSYRQRLYTQRRYLHGTAVMLVEQRHDQSHCLHNPLRD